MNEILYRFKTHDRGGVKGKPCRRHAPHRFSRIASHSPLATFLLASCLLSGCAYVKKNGTTPARPATPIETALAYNASLADANQALTNDVIVAQKAGLLSIAATSNITSVEFTVADADRQITAMLDAIAKCLGAAGSNPASCKGNASQVITLISRIQANAGSLVTSGDLGITDAKTQKAVRDTISTITSMAGLILTTLQTAGLIQ